MLSKYDLVKKKKIQTVNSYLFSKIKGKFDLIIFNPPYLPEDKREDSESSLISSGGKKGDEIIVRFLERVGRYLSKKGIILIVLSSLTPQRKILKFLKEKGFIREVISEKKIFMEKLEVWKIEKKKNKFNSYYSERLKFLT